MPVNALFQGFFDWLKRTYLEPTIQILKVRAAIYYLEGVKSARQILILICLLVFVITLIGAGLVLIPLALLLFMPWAPETKAIVGLVIGFLYLLIPSVALISLLSEKRWMKLTGANDMLKKLLD
ncbi:MAG: hypothetical protein IPH75_08430 [bacterium]|nr:hypothetical protein [bacterium]